MTTAKDIGNAIIVQIYRDAIHGGEDKLKRYLDALVKLGLGHTMFHGFPRELPGHWDRCAKLAGERSLMAMASWGLDSSASAAEKGALMGDVLARPTCAAGLADAEGAWDHTKSADDETSERGAIDLVRALRAKAPHALVGDQCWFDMDKHVAVRRNPQGKDVFAGFPVDEFAELITWFRFLQAYGNDAAVKRIHGEAGAWPSVEARMDASWSRVGPVLQRAGLDRPLGLTIQGYRWHLPSAVRCLLKYNKLKAQPVIVWSEPFPDTTWLAGYLTVKFLEAHGFIRPGLDERGIVLAYQREFNARTPEASRLVEDGDAGGNTMDTMGVFDQIAALGLAA